MDSDRELMGRIVAGDSATFEVLLDRHGEAVRRHLARMVRDDAAADDLMQEVFLRVWTRADQWSGSGTPTAWLFRVATNLALNHLRSARRRRQRPLDVRPQVGADEDPDETPVPGWMVDAAALGPDAWAELAERRELCRRLIDHLPEDKREVVRLIHEEQMDIRKVAETLGIPAGTVRSRLHYALKRLAGEWEALESEWEDV